MRKQEIYFSVDVEADGPVPGLSNMLSLGAVALTLDKQVLGTFTRNLNLLPDCRSNPLTMEWWRGQPKAWAEARQDPVDAEVAMPEFTAWVTELAGGQPPVFVGYPAPYDYAWIAYYCERFAGNNPFGHRGCLDMKSVAWAHLGARFSQISPRKFPAGWSEPEAGSHVALTDAVEQGMTFVNMIRDIRGLPPIPPIPAPAGLQTEQQQVPGHVLEQSASA